MSYIKRYLKGQTTIFSTIIILLLLETYVCLYMDKIRLKEPYIYIIRFSILFSILYSSILLFVAIKSKKLIGLVLVINILSVVISNYLVFRHTAAASYVYFFIILYSIFIILFWKFFKKTNRMDLFLLCIINIITRIFITWLLIILWALSSGIGF